MTFWAKVLVIVILVLSIAFAAASGVIFAKRTNYRGMLHKTELQAAETEKELTTQIARLEGNLADARARAKDFETQLHNRDVEFDQKTQKADELQAEVTKLMKEKDEQLAATNKLAESNRSLAEAEEKLRTRYEEIRVASEKCGDNLQAERKKTAELETDVINLTNERDDLKVALAEANKSIRETDEILAELASRNIEARTVIDGIRIIPLIKTKVADVDMEGGIIVLNAGTDQGVKKNYEFTVFRADKFVATVNVFHTEEDFCAARIVTRAADIQLGDSAWTRLP